MYYVIRFLTTSFSSGSDYITMLKTWMQ